MDSKIAVIGTGSWATALAKLLTFNNIPIVWWFRKEDSIEFFKLHHHNKDYLSSVQFNLDLITLTNDLKQAISDVDICLFAIPSAYIVEALSGITLKDLENKKIITAVKGLLRPDNITLSHYFENLGVLDSNICAITGPCHAEEVAAEKLSYLTFHGAGVKSVAKECSLLFETPFLKTAVGKDLEGAEYAAVIKNIIALAAGISVGLGYGDNFRAILISNAMKEMKKFLNTVYPGKRKILGSAYLGDTLVTAYSPHSRNRTFGVMIGKGYSVNVAILELNMVAEGYYASKAVKELCEKTNITLPICEAVYNILYNEVPPSKEFENLSILLG